MLDEVFECCAAGFPNVATDEAAAEFDTYLTEQEIADFIDGIEVVELDTDEVFDDDFIEDVTQSNALLAQFTLAKPPVMQMAFDF